MKKYLLSLVAVLFSVLGYAQTTVYSMDTADEGCQGTNNGYATNCDVEIDGVTWNVTGNAQIAPWRIGGKNLDGVDREVYTKTAVTGTVNEVVLSLGMNTLSSLNSVKLYVADNADFTSATEYVGTLPKAYPGTITYDITAAKNAYYKFVLNVSAGSSNKYVQFTSVEMNGEAATPSTVAAPVFTPEAGTYYGSVKVSATCETEGAAIQYSLNNGEWTALSEGVVITETSTLKAKAVKGTDESTVTSATYTIGKEYANLAELVNVEPAGQPVRVTLDNVAIDSIFVTKAGKRNGIYVNSGNEAHPMVEVYCYNVPEEWVAGGTVSGTIEGDWKKYNNTWEVCPANWDALTYAAPSQSALTATFDPADGSELASFEYGEKITVTFSKPEAVGYAEWKLVDNTNEEILRTGMMKKNTDGSWYGKFYSQQKLVAGHTYTVTAYPYETELDMQAEADHNTYSNALGIFTATYTGLTPGYEYSPVTVVSITPERGSEVSLENNVVVVTFSDVVTLTAERNGGQMGDNTTIPATSEDGKTWTLNIPESVLTSTTGSLNINVYVKDAEGRCLHGNMGEDENSYFVWGFACYEGAPEFTITPASGKIESLSKISIYYSGTIAISHNSVEGIKIFNGDDVVYTFADSDGKTISKNEMEFTLSTPITEAGVYTVVFPATYFALGEEFEGCSSKKQTVTYTIEGTTDGINAIDAKNMTNGKYLQNGQIVIVRNGVKYNVNGAVIR